MSQGPPDETTYRKAVNQIRSKVKNASSRSVHIYSFNVREEQLEAAHALLDKQEGRKSMRVTYSDDYNFIVRYSPMQAHKIAQLYWGFMIFGGLLALMPPPPDTLPPGVDFFGPRNGGVGHDPTKPSVIFEVGDSESLTQLEIDMKFWFQDVPEVQLVILVLIDPPISTYPNLSRITVQLWRAFHPIRPLRSPASQERQARMVWEANWSHAATPMYILFSDIFGEQVPAEYGNNDRVYLDTVVWREKVLQHL